MASNGSYAVDGQKNPALLVISKRAGFTLVWRIRQTNIRLLRDRVIGGTVRTSRRTIN